MINYMMYVLYNILLYLLLVLLSPVWILILLSGKKFRAGFWQKCGFLPASIKQRFKNFSKPPVWFHAVSVGETLAITNLVKTFHQRKPDIPIVFSTVTYTGQEIAKKRLGDIVTVFYFPYDLSFVTSKIINIVNPQLVVIVETEIWPSFVYNVYRKKLPLLLINGRLSPKSSRNYVRFSFFFSKVLNMFTQLLMQSEIDAERIISIGAEKSKVLVVGNIKYDIKAQFTPEDIVKLKNELAISGKDKILIAGSTHAGEETEILKVYLNLKKHIPALKLILVPRHPERYEEVIDLIKSEKLLLAKRSKKETFENASIFLLDTMGELSNFYSIADIAFVGGSLIEKGGHNPLEPAAYSVPVVVGPHTFNFLDITNYMLKAGAAIQVSSSDDLYATFEKLLLDEHFYNNAKSACSDVFKTNKGATKKTLEVIQSLLS